MPDTVNSYGIYQLTAEDYADALADMAEDMRGRCIRCGFKFEDDEGEDICIRCHDEMERYR